MASTKKARNVNVYAIVLLYLIKVSTALYIQFMIQKKKHIYSVDLAVPLLTSMGVISLIVYTTKTNILDKEFNNYMFDLTSTFALLSIYISYIQRMNTATFNRNIINTNSQNKGKIKELDVVNMYIVYPICICPYFLLGL